VTFNGHALGGSDDYLASLNLSTDKEGSIDAGYKRFRTFYDGVGGFFHWPIQFEAMSSQDLHVDRRHLLGGGEAGQAGPAVFTLSFHDETRTGMKDSSEWAQS